MTTQSPLRRGLNDKLYLAAYSLMRGSPNDAFSPPGFAADSLVARVSVAMTHMALLPSSFLDALPAELRKRLDAILAAGELLRQLAAAGDIGTDGRANELASLLLDFYVAVNRFDAASDPSRHWNDL